KFNSVFFDLEESLSLGAYEKKSFSVQLDKEEFRELVAGFYTLNVEVNVGDEVAKLEGMIKFVEKDDLETVTKDYGFFINTKIVEKKNEGNVIVDSEVVIKKNIVSRLFTTMSPEPDIVNREGFDIVYVWNEELRPGESLEVVVKTNWLFPLLFVIFVVVVVVLVKQFSKTHLVLKKKVSFVKAKGGEFALKVSIIVSAKKFVERISIVDRIPSLVKVHERFLGSEPGKIDEKNKRIRWEFDKLEKGESRVLSYLIYSKVGVLGKFALPAATAIFEKEGKIYETTSNRAFFISEQRGEKKENQNF
ncbi:hypothetical protein ACFL0X_02415, partial [Nanoarchaeota archaeon]